MDEGLLGRMVKRGTLARAWAGIAVLAIAGCSVTAVEPTPSQSGQPPTRDLVEQYLADEGCSTFTARTDEEAFGSLAASCAPLRELMQREDAEQAVNAVYADTEPAEQGSWWSIEREQLAELLVHIRIVRLTEAQNESSP